MMCSLTCSAGSTSFCSEVILMNYPKAGFAGMVDGEPMVPLVVDLDGTLSATDTLHEALLRVGTAHWTGLPGLATRLRGPKADFKRRVSDLVTIDGAELVYREDVLELVRGARAAGRRTVLASAGDQRQVDRVAAHLGLFDEAHGTGGAAGADVNLGGAAKAAFLTECFGEGGFDYVGDHAADAPVWKAARRAITVGADTRLRRAAEAANADVLHLAAPEAGSRRLRPYLKALRPHQWSKNTLVFLPALAAHDAGSLGAALVAFVAFCLTASSVYVINDLTDLAADRAHPRKRLRPFASGAIPARDGVMLASGLIAAAVLLGLLFAPPLFLAALVAYYAATFAYSLWLKRKLLVDVLTLAGLYTIRIVAGAAAAAVALSPWMLGFAMFLFLSLAAVKRQAELMDLAGSGRASKASGRAYDVDDLPILRGMALSAGHGAVLILALYVNSEDVTRLYDRPEVLWLACPLLIYWICRMVMMAHRGHMTDDPIVYAARDRVSRGVLLCGVGVFVLAGI
jgi:4-hydroxybenzoate polyprenyltransferase